jgi:hypothetical protein
MLVIQSPTNKIMTDLKEFERLSTKEKIKVIQCIVSEELIPRLRTMAEDKEVQELFSMDLNMSVEDEQNAENVITTTITVGTFANLIQAQSLHCIDSESYRQIMQETLRCVRQHEITEELK